jgi:hypothetical protein
MPRFSTTISKEAWAREIVEPVADGMHVRIGTGPIRRLAGILG